MEPVHGTNSASNSASDEEDVISRMPENVITHILDRLPIRDAVGTSILSRFWRFNWTLLTRLVINESNEGYDWRNIDRLVIHLKGPVTTFVLYVYDMELDVKYIIRWVMILARKGIKEFTLINMHETSLKLPTHLFSCLELKQLRLHNCSFCPLPSFRGFPNLLSLDLCLVTDIGNSVKIFTKCPLLEILKITYLKPIGNVKLVEIAKLKNLKVLSLPLCMVENITITSSTIFQLGGYLPQLQVLTLGFEECQLLGEGETGPRESFDTIFPCLKTLVLHDINLNSTSVLSCVIEMIWGSPNLKSLTLMFQNEDDVPHPPHALSSSEAGYNTLGQLQLLSVVFDSFRGSENEECLIKYLLASSPLLKTFLIYSKNSSEMSDENLMFAAKLLKFHQASPLAEVKFFY